MRLPSMATLDDAVYKWFSQLRDVYKRQALHTFNGDSVEVGIKIEMVTEELCQMVVNLTVLADNLFSQVQNEP